MQIKVLTLHCTVIEVKCAHICFVHL